MEISNEGMPISIAKHFIISGCAETIRYYAGWATKISGSTVNLSLPDERGKGLSALPIMLSVSRSPSELWLPSRLGTCP